MTFMKREQYRFILGLAAMIGAFALLSVPAAAKPVVDEYTLDIPSPKGDKKFNPYEKPNRGGSGGGSGSGGSGSGSGGGSLSPAIEQQLADSEAGAALAAVATDPALGAPAGSGSGSGSGQGQGQGGSGSGSGQGGSGSGSVSATGELSPDSPGAFAAVTGSRGEVVPTLAFVILLMAGIGALLLYLRRRGSLPGSGG